MNKKELRWVYGTKTGRWYLVGSDDRNYSAGIPVDRFSRLGKNKAQNLYFKRNRQRSIR